MRPFLIFLLNLHLQLVKFDDRDKYRSLSKRDVNGAFRRTLCIPQGEMF